VARQGRYSAWGLRIVVWALLPASQPELT